MANILVTGGAGYVGSACCEELLAEGHSVVVVDDLSKGHRDAVFPLCVFYQEDIGNRPRIAEILRSHAIEVVFHFAAKALVPESVVNPGLFFDHNVARGINLLEAMRDASVKRFVLSSTAAVYGNPVNESIREDDPKQPVNSYGESKLLFEHILDWYARAYQWNAVAFRYFNASGATAHVGERHDPETHIIPLLLQVATGQRESFTIAGTDYPTPDGTCIRDYVHVTDIAQAHLQALSRERYGEFRAYNIGTSRSYSVREVCDAVQSVVGKKLNIQEGKRRLGDPSILRADPSRLKSELGWSPKRSDLKGIIESAWNFSLKLASGSPETLAMARQ